jgi:argininosuccinate lyase
LRGVTFRAENIKLADALHAAERANELVVREGLPFRDAYRKVAAALSKVEK